VIVENIAECTFGEKKLVALIVLHYEDGLGGRHHEMSESIVAIRCS
jgi:hypothetical protein